MYQYHRFKLLFLGNWEQKQSGNWEQKINIESGDDHTPDNKKLSQKIGEFLARSTAPRSND